MSRLDIGYEFDRYRVERKLGQGGAATVYAVRHLRLDSLQALKVMHVTTESFQHRLLQEGRGQAGLRHPNVVSVFDVLDIDGAPALLMEYVGGPTLGALIKSTEFTVPEALWLFRGVVLGVGAAHRRGMVHRDLKPDNVLLAPTNDGIVPKVTDFGLVKMAHTSLSPSQLGRAIGTAPYMSPEQVSGAADIDQRADMWALGCILYELVTGIRAFRGSNTLDTFNKVRNADYVPVQQHIRGVPPPVQVAIERMLQPDLSQRLTGVDHLFELLFDCGLSMDRVDLPADSGTPVSPVQLSGNGASRSHQPDAPSLVTAVTAIATPPPAPPSSMRIAPLGPDPSDGHTVEVVTPMPVAVQKPLKRVPWIPMASTALAILAAIAICVFLLTQVVPALGASESPVVTSPEMHSPSGDSP